MNPAFLFGLVVGTCSSVNLVLCVLTRDWVGAGASGVALILTVCLVGVTRKGW